MKISWIRSILLSIILMSGLGEGRSQSSAKIQNVRFTQAAEIIEINYDLIDAQPDETFKVWIKAFLADGEEIPAATLEGDIGEGISAGLNKKIFWRVQDDLVNASTNIYIEVYTSSSLGRRGKFPTNILKSVVLPGWGQSSKGKPYWLLGVGTYGLLAGSVLLNQRAENDYSSYLEATEGETRNALFTAAENKDRTSKIMAYSAGAIWIGNVIWSALSKKKDVAKLSFYPNPQVPGMGISYKF